VEFNNLKASLFIVAAMVMITTNDAIIKHITQVFGIGKAAVQIQPGNFR
jgi:hypothetical protein